MAEDRAAQPDAATHVRAVLASGDHAALVELIDTRLLELWFGMPPDELGRMLTTIPPDVLARRPRVLALRAAFSARDVAEGARLRSTEAREPVVRRLAESGQVEPHWVVLAEPCAHASAAPPGAPTTCCGSSTK